MPPDIELPAPRMTKSFFLIVVAFPVSDSGLFYE